MTKMKMISTEYLSRDIALDQLWLSSFCTEEKSYLQGLGNAQLSSNTLLLRMWPVGPQHWHRHHIGAC